MDDSRTPAGAGRWRALRACLPTRPHRHLRACAWMLSGLLAACGGGGGGGGDAPGNSTPPATGAPPASPAVLALPAPVPGSGTVVRLQSFAGDTLGQGSSQNNTLADAGIAVEAAGSGLKITVRGERFWEIWIRTDTVGNLVREGQHTGLRRNILGGDSVVGFDVQREAQACQNADGLLSVDRVVYAQGALAEVELRFAQRCDGATGQLQGQVRWVASEQPVRAAAAPVPADLWRPAATAVPAAGNWVYIEANGFEPVFEGRTQTFTEQNSVLDVNAAGDRIDINVRGFDLWFARLRGIQRPEGLTVGHYPMLRGFGPRYNPARGALSWYRGTAICDDPSGWFALDRIEYAQGALTALEFRFEQRCPSHAGVVRGMVRWQAAQRQLPPAPATAPAGLWAPATTDLPAAGSYLLLESEPGDFIGGGSRRLLLPAGTNFLVFDDRGTLRTQFLERDRNVTWRGEFRSRYTVERLEVGYRGPLSGNVANTAIGGLSFSGDGRGCSLGEGWFVVDEVSHRHGILRSLTLRFEQRCLNSSAALRGQLRWQSDDPLLTAGPADAPLPEPALAPPPEMPSSGSALLLQSRGLDFQGGGRDWLYTGRTAIITAERASFGQLFQFGVVGDQSWTGQIWLPEGQSRVLPGRFPFTSSFGVPGGGHAFSLSGDGRACDNTTGWLDIDRAVYDGDRLTLLELRFEQRCTGSPYPLYGQFRWVAGEPLQLAQPMVPPQGLWAPPEDLLPASGNYAFLLSPPGAFVGRGQSRLLQPTPGNTLMSNNAGQLSFSYFSSSGSSISVTVVPPYLEPLLQAGYYPSTRLGALGNPLKVGLTLGVDGGTCGAAESWLVIDDIAYDAAGLVRIALRGKRWCNDGGPPVYVALRWAR